MGIGYNPRIITSGLGFNVDFSNLKSINGTTLTDMTKNNIPITLINGSANTMNITDGYAEFNPTDISGTHTYFSIANSYFNTIKSEISIETAMYVYDLFGNNQYGRGVSPRTTETSSPLGFSLGNGNITAEVNTTTGWKSGNFSSATLLGLNKWVYISQTTSVSEDTFKTYINGNLYITVSLAGSTPNGGNGFLLGRGFYGGIRNYKGRISFLRVYEKKLTPLEIQQNFNAFRARYGV